jgi:TolB-like protein/Tfp pilus assembly protein PilF
MEPLLASATVCSVCGEPLSAKSGCVACLLRAGLDEGAQEDAPAPSSLVFGDFEIARREDGSFWELGCGAMGVTYRAMDKVLHRSVALKVIETPTAAGDSRAVRERFLREARAAAALKHPNVAGIFQFGAASEIDRCYYAMELVEGETLEALVRREGPLKVELALEIAIQVTRALIGAAAQGLIHRDLKPGNIMITRSDSAMREMEVKVIDFGLAKATVDAVGDMDLTHGGFVGTPTFASPEQFAGKAADARSDIYSLGVTLWYALTGEVPYRGKTIEEIRSSQTEVPLPVEQLVARKIPAPVIKLLRRILATDPAERPQSARALSADLERGRSAMEVAPRRRKRRQAVALALGLFAICAAGLTSYLLHRQHAADAMPPEKSIAVLPFENLSNDKENAFFAAGIQDDVLTSLAQIHELKVISRTSVMAYQKHGERNMREISQALGVANILEGSVRRTGNRVLVNVQLIDARNDRHIWAERYDRTVADSIGLQGELATQIAATLKAKLAPEEKARLEAKPTDNPEAYALYVKARGREAAVNQSTEDLTAAEQRYAEAIALDPKFALAHARLSIVNSYLAIEPSDNRRTLKRKARAAAEEALRLSPSLGEAHMALGFCLYFAEKDYAAALKEFSIAAATSPNEPDIFYFISAIYRRQGRWRESLATYQRAQDRDPRNREVILRAADSHLFVRDWAGATACYDRALEIAPDSADARISLAYIEVFRNDNPAAGRKLLQNIPPGIDPDGIVTESRWDLAMLERDYASAEKILTDSPFAGFPRAGEGAKAFFQGRTALARGDVESAQRYFAAAAPSFEGRMRDDPDNADSHAQLGLLYAYMHRKEDALREGRRAVDLEPENRDAFHGVRASANLALVYALLGEPDQAITLIERLLSTPGPLDWPDFPQSITLADLRLRWEWDSLRSDPRFQKIFAGPEPETMLTTIHQVAPAAPEKSIAVLPFENLSDDKQNAYFAGGVQDEILSDLAKIADLKVISRTSVMQYKSGAERNLREIGQALGVAHVVEGSVQRVANRVRVNAQLIDARNDAHLWAETYDRDLADVFAIQTEIAQRIADQLQAKILPNEKAAIEQRPTNDLAAYDLYVQATSLIDKAAYKERKEGGKDYFQAIELLNQAIARDPAFLLAYCRLAEAHDELYFLRFDYTSSRLDLAKSAINSAFRLKPDSGEAHLALATHFYHGYFDYDRARDELAIAVRTLPNNARIFEWTGFIDRRQSRWHDAVRNFERAVELDPRNVKILTSAAVTHHLVRNYGQERRTMDRLSALEPNNIGHRLGRAWIDVRERANTRAVHAVLEKILADNPESAGLRLDLALYERDAVAADHALAALAALGEDTFDAGRGGMQFSRAYLQSSVARMKGDAAAAHVAFTVARAQQEKAVRAQPDYGPPLCVLGLIDAALGRKEEALREGRRALELAPMAKDYLDGVDVLYIYAVICAWTGEHDLAIEQLETLAKIPAGPSYGEIRLSPNWDPLRGDPRFEKIVAKLAPSP